MRNGHGRTGAVLRLGSALALALAGCETPNVEWTTFRSAAVPRGGVILRADGRLSRASPAIDGIPVRLPSGVRCPGSLSLARAASVLYGVWWAPRDDSSAWLLFARSTDRGSTWSAPRSVDTTDRAVSGCRREPPSIVADSANGYLHVAYALTAPEGSGLFFSHSMDGGATFHAPVASLYGDRPGRMSVAADGELVAVAFEDPNSRMPRVGLALSRTMGHIFEQHLLPVSSDVGEATHPLVAVHAHRIALAWEQRAATDSPAALVIRAGVIH